MYWGGPWWCHQRLCLCLLPPSGSLPRLVNGYWRGLGAQSERAPSGLPLDSDFRTGGVRVAEREGYSQTLAVCTQQRDESDTVTTAHRLGHAGTRPASITTSYRVCMPSGTIARQLQRSARTLRTRALVAQAPPNICYQDRGQIGERRPLQTRRKHRSQPGQQEHHPIISAYGKHLRLVSLYIYTRL